MFVSIFFTNNGNRNSERNSQNFCSIPLLPVKDKRIGATEERENCDQYEFNERNI